MLNRASVSFAAVFRVVMIGSFSLSEIDGGAMAQTEDTVAVRVVGCPADGQGGPIAAPATSGPTPKVAASVAPRLTYYVFQDLGVLAPSGWHCFAWYGSNGRTVFVTPEPHDSSKSLYDKKSFTGPAVQLSFRYGDTSGRFEVAQIAARIFPIAAPFVQNVINEGIERPEDFPSTPYPHDKLVRRSATEVEFETPSNAEGLGTRSGLAKNSEAIDGVAIIFPEEGMDLVMLTVRLSPDMRDLSSTIIANVEQN